MEKTKLKYIVDVLMGISFVIVAVTGIIKYAGVIQAFGMSYSDLPMRTISSAHDNQGLIMTFLVMAHLALNWDWIVCMTKKYLKME